MPDLDPKEVFQIAVPMICGGLGGAVFKHWIDRRYTVVGYTLTSYPLARLRLTSMLRDMTVLLAGQQVANLPTHVAEVALRRGFHLSHMDVSLEFDASIEFLSIESSCTTLHGKVAHSVHDTGLVVQLGPLLPGERFTVRFATDSEVTPAIKTATPKVKLVAWSDVRECNLTGIQLALLFSVSALTATLVFLVNVMFGRFR